MACFGSKDIEHLTRHEWTSNFILDDSNVDGANDEDAHIEECDSFRLVEIAKEMIGDDVIGAGEYLMGRGYKIKVVRDEPSTESK